MSQSATSLPRTKCRECGGLWGTGDIAPSVRDDKCPACGWVIGEQTRMERIESALNRIQQKLGIEVPR